MPSLTKHGQIFSKGHHEAGSGSREEAFQLNSYNKSFPLKVFFL